MLEREILCNNVLPDLQLFCSEWDVELDCCTFFETKDFIKNVDQLLILRQLLNKENTIALVIYTLLMFFRRIILVFCGG